MKSEVGILKHVAAAINHSITKTLERIILNAKRIFLAVAVPGEMPNLER